MVSATESSLEDDIPAENFHTPPDEVIPQSQSSDEAKPTTVDCCDGDSHHNRRTTHTFPDLDFSHSLFFRKNPQGASRVLEAGCLHSPHKSKCSCTSLGFRTPAADVPRRKSKRSFASLGSKSSNSHRGDDAGGKSKHSPTYSGLDFLYPLTGDAPAGDFTRRESPSSYSYSADVSRVKSKLSPTLRLNSLYTTDVATGSVDVTRRKSKRPCPCLGLKSSNSLSPDVAGGKSNFSPTRLRLNSSYSLAGDATRGKSKHNCPYLWSKSSKSHSGVLEGGKTRISPPCLGLNFLHTLSGDAPAEIRAKSKLPCVCFKSKSSNLRSGDVDDGETKLPSTHLELKSPLAGNAAERRSTSNVFNSSENFENPNDTAPVDRNGTDAAYANSLLEEDGERMNIDILVDAALHVEESDAVNVVDVGGNRTGMNPVVEAEKGGGDGDEGGLRSSRKGANVSINDNMEGRQLPFSLSGRECDVPPQRSWVNCVHDILNVLSKGSQGQLVDEDVVEVARDHGVRFPRPRWWSRDGYGKEDGRSGQGDEVYKFDINFSPLDTNDTLLQDC